MYSTELGGKLDTPKLTKKSADANPKIKRALAETIV